MDDAALLNVARLNAAMMIAAGELEGGLAAARIDEVNDANRGALMGTALLMAAQDGSAARLSALLAAGANPNACNVAGMTALHWAAFRGEVACAEVLLAGGADPRMPQPATQWSPAHLAARRGDKALLRMLLAAAPDLAVLKSLSGSTPLGQALETQRRATALYLISEAPVVQPASEQLALLNQQAQPIGQQVNAEERAALEPLYAAVAARQHLTAAEWALVPAPCPGLGAALPTVLKRSAEEAALLVQHMPPDERARLCSAALCLARVTSAAPLPTPVLWRLLALLAA